MAEYYVDFLAGDNANPGTAESPWKTPPQFGGGGPGTTITSADTLYVAGSITAEGSGSSLWQVNTGRYRSGCKIRGWPGRGRFFIDAARAWSRVVAISGVATEFSDADLTGSREDEETSVGLEVQGVAAAGTIVRNVRAFDNGRFGIRLNNVGADARITLIDVTANDNTTLPTDNGGAGRFAAGISVEGSGKCVLLRCQAHNNGRTALREGTDVDGRGISISGVSSAGTRVLDCATSGNGDPTGILSPTGTPNGTGLEGFSCSSIYVRGFRSSGEAAGAEIKSAANDWTIEHSVFAGIGLTFQWGQFSGIGSTGLILRNVTIINDGVKPFAECLAISSGNAEIRNVVVWKRGRSDWMPVRFSSEVFSFDPATIVIDGIADINNNDPFDRLVKHVTSGGTVYYTREEWRVLHPSHFANYHALQHDQISTHVRPPPGSPLLTGGVDLGYLRDIEGKQSKGHIGCYGAARILER
jgi:hypothetical protein